MRTLNIAILLLATVLSGCSTLVPAPALPSPNAAVAEADRKSVV